MGDLTYASITLKGYHHDINSIKDMLKDEYKDALVDGMINCYIDEIGGFHEGGIGTDPDGNECGECFHSSCKECSVYVKAQEVNSDSISTIHDDKRRYIL